MKTFLSIGFTFLLFGCASHKAVRLTVPAGQTVELDYATYEAYEARLRNKSRAELEVAVLDKQKEEQVSGFGLAAKGKADLKISQDQKLVLRNSSGKAVKLSIDLSERPAGQVQASPEYISFVLKNKSAQSIPLIIPGVMNPNLSPFSESRVSLAVGQKLYFREGWKRHELFTVNAQIATDSLVEVSALLKARKAALGLD